MRETTFLIFKLDFGNYVCIFVLDKNKVQNF